MRELSGRACVVEGGCELGVRGHPAAISVTGEAQNRDSDPLVCSDLSEAPETYPPDTHMQYQTCQSPNGVKTALDSSQQSQSPNSLILPKIELSLFPSFAGLSCFFLSRFSSWSILRFVLGFKTCVTFIHLVILIWPMPPVTIVTSRTPTRS